MLVAVSVKQLEIGCDSVCFILSEQVDLLCDWLKKQAGAGALWEGS